MSELTKNPIQYGKWFTDKKGGIFEVFATGHVDELGTPCTVYESVLDGHIRVCPFEKFNDGRFVDIGGYLTPQEQQAQAERCGCRGTNDMCGCQNTPDRQTLTERAAALHEEGGAE